MRGNWDEFTEANISTCFHNLRGGSEYTMFEKPLDWLVKRLRLLDPNEGLDTVAGSDQIIASWVTIDITTESAWSVPSC